MGAWGSGNLENDDALDFLHGEFEAGGADAVQDVFAAVREGLESGYIEAPIGSAGLAAAEVVAASLGQHISTADEQVLAELLVHQAAVAELPDVVDDAVQTIDAITSSEARSELYSLWIEAGSGDEFLNNVADLRSRLKGTQR